MISANDLKYLYVKLYAELRNYVWTLDVLEAIADLEVAIFTTFPKEDEIKRALEDLYRLGLKELDLDDDDPLKQAYTALSDKVNEADGFYCKLNKLMEV